MLSLTLKEEIKKQIDVLEDDEILNEIKHLLTIDNNNDWWNDISNQTQKSIEEGYNDWKLGKVFTHNEVIESIKK